jgi:hypothetical protein
MSSGHLYNFLCSLERIIFWIKIHNKIIIFHLSFLTYFHALFFCKCLLVSFSGCLSCWLDRLKVIIKTIKEIKSILFDLLNLSLWKFFCFKYLSHLCIKECCICCEDCSILVSSLFNKSFHLIAIEQPRYFIAVFSYL